MMETAPIVVAPFDAELFGQQIRSGDKLVLWYISANRDEAVFDDPDRREPYSNVEGAPGIVAALSVDSARVHVE